MTKNYIIECNNIWKKYNTPVLGIKSLLLNKKFKGSQNWVLKDLSLKVMKGTSLGILGSNGVGKTTLLSIIHGTLLPDKGTVKTTGHITGMMHLGGGFHPSLTGKDNIITYGTLIGIDPNDLKEKWVEISEFAGLRDVMGEQLRTYSSGMIVRLAFATLAFSATNIMLIDEVLAVGDKDFQIICKDYIKKFKKRGGTLVVVSHDIEQLKMFCDDGLLLQKNKKEVHSDINDILNKHDLKLLGDFV